MMDAVANLRAGNPGHTQDALDQAANELEDLRRMKLRAREVDETWRDEWSATAASRYILKGSSEA